MFCITSSLLSIEEARFYSFFRAKDVYYCLWLHPYLWINVNMHLTNECLISSLWESYREDLLRFFLSRVKTYSDAEDLVQEIFIRLHTQKDKISEIQCVSAWIFTIARNLVADYYRKRKIEIHQELVHDLFENAHILCDLHISKGLSDLQTILNTMSDEYHTIIWQTDVLGEPLTHFATSQNISINTAKTQKRRARSIMHKKIDARCSFERDSFGRIIDYSFK